MYFLFIFVIKYIFYILNSRDSSDQWEYFMPFDINERDATGQNILYVAALLGNKDLLDVILNFRAKSTRISQSDVS